MVRAVSRKGHGTSLALGEGQQGLTPSLDRKDAFILSSETQKTVARPSRPVHSLAIWKPSIMVTDYFDMYYHNGARSEFSSSRGWREAHPHVLLEDTPPLISYLARICSVFRAVHLTTAPLITYFFQILTILRVVQSTASESVLKIYLSHFFTGIRALQSITF